MYAGRRMGTSSVCTMKTSGARQTARARSAASRCQRYDAWMRATGSTRPSRRSGYRPWTRSSPCSRRGARPNARRPRSQDRRPGGGGGPRQPRQETRCAGPGRVHWPGYRQEPYVRRKLRKADPATPVAVLAEKEEALAAALAEPDADWVYVRFVPTAARWPGFTPPRSGSSCRGRW